MKRIIFIAIVMTIILANSGCASRQPNVKLWVWERGIAVESCEQEGMAMYLWFYEWNMFDAVHQGEHTAGGYKAFSKKASEDGKVGELVSDNMRLTMRAVKDGAEMELKITNRSGHDWPELAGIIPCFNPGPKKKPNLQFANTNTYFLGCNGLESQQKREIHFNDQLCPLLGEISEKGEYVFSHKWPTSEKNASAGIMIRESTDGNWVTGIAWEDFLSAQGHNPWQCIHLCIRVGPLKQSATRT
ncbi:MAG: hypothetical protein ACYTF1_21985, partial [Planctomycetota bacterium]